MWRLCGQGFDRKATENERNRNRELEMMRSRRNDYAHLERFMPMAPRIKFPLKCSLEELYNGATKRTKLFPDFHDGFGNYINPLHLEDIVVKIPPGLSHGDPIFFPTTRDIQAGMIPPDVILVIQEEPHSVYKRIGSDLWVTKEITLVEALTEETVTVELLDKRILTIQIPQEPGPPIKIINEGMPIPNLGIKGSLFVGFDVVFPRNLCLTKEQKEELKNLLSEEGQ